LYKYFKFNNSHRRHLRRPPPPHIYFLTRVADEPVSKLTDWSRKWRPKWWRDWNL